MATQCPGSTTSVSKAYELAWTATLTAVCIASRQFLQFLPNIKPVTSIVCLTATLISLRSALLVATGTTILSSLLLGTGPYVIYQCLAWYTIAILYHLLHKTKLGRTMVVELIYMFLSGFLFGAIVSLERLHYGGLPVYLGYWVAGLPFDLLHAIGNTASHPVCKKAMTTAMGVRR